MSPFKQDGQQQQAEVYFRAAADEWQQKAEGRVAEYNIIEARNRAVLTVLESLPDARRLLDVGCGTGQLVIAAAQRGVDSVGIDFAKEMIERCEANRQSAGVPATFVFGSFFDMPAPEQAYDVVSAQGFIEYVEPEQMEEFFARSARMLRSGGALAIGSRNRLFNLLSLNAFTEAELELGTVRQLIEQAIALHMSDSQEAAFAALRRLEQIDAQPQRYPRTGIGVDVRHQYSPAELVLRLRRHGFSPKCLYPVHFHGLPVQLKAAHPNLHAQLATLIDSIALADPRVVPFSSTFVLDVRKDP